MISKDRGSTIIIESEFKKQTPFGVLSLIDPSSAKVTVIDSKGTKKVDAADMTKSTLGKWYYNCQTVSDWETGIYIVYVTSIYNGLNDVTYERQAFRLT